MDIRKQIIEQLDKPVEYEKVKLSEVSLLEDMQYGAGFSYESRYKKLKDCLHLVVSNNRDDLDLWFKGVIESLCYRPNKYVLVLEGKGGIGKTEFFRRLFPVPIKEVWATSDLKDLIYTDSALNFEFTKKSLNYPMEENFVVNDCITEVDSKGNKHLVRQAWTDKRLASYCSTTNHWQHPPRKNFIVLHLESINHELFNSIDKLQLWIEIFNKFKFKPEGK